MLIFVAFVAAGAVVRGVRRRRSERHVQVMLDAYAETIDLLLATLRAGYTLQQSILMLAEVAPRDVRHEFVEMRSRVEHGTPITAALADCKDRLDPSFRPVIETVISSIRLGVPTESFIVQVQAEVHHIRRHVNEVRARQLAVRLSLPLVLCALPSFALLVIVPVIAGTLSHLQTKGSGP